MKDTIKSNIKKVCFRTVNDSDLLLDQGILDSITTVDLSVALEKEFNITIPFVDINRQNFNTADSICNYIQIKVKPRS